MEETGCLICGRKEANFVLSGRDRRYPAQGLFKLLSACGFAICNLRYTLAPGAIVECLGFIEEDLRETKRQAGRCLVGMLLKHKSALLLFWRPLALFLYFVGLSGGLEVVAKPEK